ncbi:DNA-directed RNA polymerase I subunit RPA1 [Uranotaenia lowii]|uniref:DNA-directed RNA polymerase I subunit RPA1 n=1 Tax=Uranotaenia lowii TaxID=190385 RepID=UPI0024797C8C|nr:DNA-directed RNA polymerase I subunit RPA1 [Uranotaenia lowii]XP_055600729.1 DNA-directed RNA polymerase I subunit RPA1 [Uranotaenia lowii]XP_055600730.1 DNA-directed RNA polymerase I subunit RPA1 [Uranotaenia lowii]XP_055600731.1 DNA-directed RNA polymerase I subunit RPA1 [Uranotaenia lowii]
MTIDQNLEVNLDPTNLKFSVFSSEDIKRISVAKIVTPRSFDELGHAIPGGLYDAAMGPSGRGEVCSTCVKDINSCEGHFGHIEICLPVFNPFFVRTVYNLLRICCTECFRIQLHDTSKSLLELQLQLVDAGYIVEAEELEVFKQKVALYPGAPLPEELNYYMELLLTHPYNTLCTTKNSEAIRTAIVNSTLKDAKKLLCIHCKGVIKKVRFSNKRLVFSMNRNEMRSFYASKGDNEVTDEMTKATNRILFANECQTYFRQLYANDGALLRQLFPILNSTAMEHPVDMFFMDVIPVQPPIVRPVRRVDGMEIIEHPQSTVLQSILMANALLRSILVVTKKADDALGNGALDAEMRKVYEEARGETANEKLYNAWIELQVAVDISLDTNLSKEKSKTRGCGLKQIIEKKEGLLRMHMMGKRVNHAARTVITPDPNIGVDEIGIPVTFAKRLNYPVPVTPWNVAELRKMVLNGPDVYPGANMIEDSNGQVSKISAMNVTQRQSMAKTLLTPHSSNQQGVKVVHRHLLDGDILLLNRQPTLHRPSIMGHKAKILSGEKIFRLHYSNCKSYNADFDGDEMNAHFPQSELARSEAYNIVAVPHQYLVPKDGTPLGGLIQDHIVSAVKLFIRGKFFNKEDYQQLVFQALSNQRGNIQLLPPTILKPAKLWSGKQIISTIIKNIIPKGLAHINMIGNAKLGTKHWQTETARNWEAGGTPLVGIEMSESEVFIRHGELLVGILDKNHFGATPYGLIHCMYELYGGNCSTSLLSSLSRLFTYYLQWEGFTLGVKDILVQRPADKKRSKIIKACRKIGHETAAAALELPPDVSEEELFTKMDEAYAKNPRFRTIMDRQYKTALDTFTNQINEVCIPTGLISKFPDNNLQMMVQSGAKGSTVNTMQISCLLGQIELEGKRPPLMISGKSLPSFASFETSPKSGGFIDGRFMTGIQPQDFFFHCMAGREGLIDTAVKTSRSGYLQRCLVKHLEGLNVHYDMTVRDSDNSVVQFMYGEDGMDISKAQFIENSKQMRFLDLNRDVIVQPEIVKKLNNDEDLNEQIKAHVKKMKSWCKKNGHPIRKERISPFAKFSAEVRDQVLAETTAPDERKAKTGRQRITEKLIKKWRKADPDRKAKYSNKYVHCPDPTNSLFRPDSCFGALTEHLEDLIKSYEKSHQPIHDMSELIKIKNSIALVAPGEPVGLLAAQSIGEPSTQMTLNTFHFAGRGEMNVTLGIPRLREILMLASQNIKTPSMEIPFLPRKSAKKLKAISEQMRKTLNRVTVADLLENINVKSRLILRPSRSMEYVIRFNFLPHDAYSHDFRVTPAEVLRYMSRVFFQYMFRVIFSSAKQRNVLIEIETERKPTGTGTNEEGDDLIDSQVPDMTQMGGDDGSGSSDEDGGANADDADATDSRRKSKKSDEMDYETDDNEDNVDKEDDEEVDIEDHPASERTANISGDEEEEPKTEDQAEEALNVSVGELEEATEKMLVVKQSELINDYTYDKVNHRWCQVSFHIPLKFKDIDFTKLLRKIAEKSVVWEVPKIRKAITYMQNDQLYLKTDGINIYAMTKYTKILDLNRLYSNDIYAIAKTYGIEAASRVLVKEVQNVFQVYGITINPRHLLLVADYMTADGTYKSMSRKGMESNVSPLQQMSFESSIQFLKAAALKGNSDHLDSPSSRLMVGQLCKSGTGCFGVYSTVE